MAVGVHIGVTMDVSEGDEADGLAKLGFHLDAVGGEQTCGTHFSIFRFCLGFLVPKVAGDWCSESISFAALDRLG